MNLYKIIFDHYAPGDSEKGIKCLLLAEDDERVYEWFKTNPDINGSRIYTYWSDREDPEEYAASLGIDEKEIADMEPYKDKIIRLKGDINDDDVDFSDAYYGITLYGWELLEENTDIDYTKLEKLGILYRA